MRWNAESTLVLLALALYLFDSARLLHSNEALLVRQRGGWAAKFGARNWPLAGREPLWAGLFSPHRVAFKMTWRFEAAVRPFAPQALEAQRDLARLAPFALLGLGLLVVGLPLALLGHMGLVFTLLVIAGIYVNNLVALIVLWTLRRRLHLDARRFAAVAAECLLCPPFAIHLIARIAALQPDAGDFYSACQALLAAGPMVEVKQQCLARLEDQILMEPEGSARAQALQLARAKFQ